MGSSSDSRSAMRVGSVSVIFFRPPPILRIRPFRGGCWSSLIPLPIVLLSDLERRLTWLIPPNPTTKASVARNTRHCRSSSVSFITAYCSWVFMPLVYTSVCYLWKRPKGDIHPLLAKEGWTERSPRSRRPGWSLSPHAFFNKKTELKKEFRLIRSAGSEPCRSRATGWKCREHALVLSDLPASRRYTVHGR